MANRSIFVTPYSSKSGRIANAIGGFTSSFLEAQNKRKLRELEYGKLLEATRTNRMSEQMGIMGMTTDISMTNERLRRQDEAQQRRLAHNEQQNALTRAQTGELADERWDRDLALEQVRGQNDLALLTLKQAADQGLLDPALLGKMNDYHFKRQQALMKFLEQPKFSAPALNNDHSPKVDKNGNLIFKVWDTDKYGLYPNKDLLIQSGLIPGVGPGDALELAYNEVMKAVIPEQSGTELNMLAERTIDMLDESKTMAEIENNINKAVELLSTLSTNPHTQGSVGKLYSAISRAQTLQNTLTSKELAESNVIDKIIEDQDPFSGDPYANAMGSEAQPTSLSTLFASSDPVRALGASSVWDTTPSSFRSKSGMFGR